MRSPALDALPIEADVSGLTEYIDVTNAELGPVPADVLAQVRADIAAADARIGYRR